MLTLEDAAAHWDLSPDALRRKIKTGDLHAVRINRRYRLDWPDIWAASAAPCPVARGRIATSWRCCPRAASPRR